MSYRRINDRVAPHAQRSDGGSIARRTLAALTVIMAFGSSAGAEPVALLGPLDRPLVADVAGGRARVQLSGLLDVEGYYVDQRPPGLLFGGGDSFVNPRLSLFLDSRIDRAWYVFVEARADRGFDPRADAAAFRFDQYLLRYTPFAAGLLDVQVGKFATVVGNWVARHDSWTNPLVNAPLPYENVTTASDVKAPASRSGFLDRRDMADRKREWVPLIWGPSYASGVAVFARQGTADFALEVKNASLSSRPAVWDARHRGFAHPTVSGRVGWRPSAAWRVGASLSGGTYLRDDVDARAAGFRVGAHHQELAAVDAAYGWRHLELWAEAFVGRFEVPRVGNADTFAYYVEGRYKLTPRIFAALRWNEQFYNAVKDDTGHERSWDYDAWRVDAALGCRLDRHVQAKLQYSYSHQNDDLQQGEQLVAAQVTVKF